MKKLKRTLCVSLVLAMLFSLVACNGFSLPAFLIKGDRVESESGWKRAFDYDEVTNVTVTHTYSASEEEDWEKGEYTYKFDGNKMHLVTEYSFYDADKAEDGEQPKTKKSEGYIFFGEDGNYHSYLYDDEEGEWHEQKASLLTAAETISSLLSAYKSSYSSFTYSEYHKGYVKGYDPESEDSSEYDITIVKIKDEKVSVVQKQSRDEDSKSSSYTWIRAVDDTTVDIPDDIPVKPAEKDVQPEEEVDGTYYEYYYQNSSGYKNKDRFAVMKKGELIFNDNSYTSTGGTNEKKNNKIYWYFTLYGYKYEYELEKVSDGVLKLVRSRAFDKVSGDELESINVSGIYFCKEGKTPSDN